MHILGYVLLLGWDFDGILVAVERVDFHVLDRKG